MVTEPSLDDLSAVPTIAVQVARWKRPAFGAYGIGPETEAWFSDSLSAVEASGAPLAALWVFDYADQPEWTVTPTNERAWQFEAIIQANQRMR